MNDDQIIQIVQESEEDEEMFEVKSHKISIAEMLKSLSVVISLLDLSREKRFEYLWTH